MRRFLAVLWHSKSDPLIASAALRLGRGECLDVICHSSSALLMAQDIEAFALNTQALSGAIVGDLYYRHGPGKAFDGSPADVERLTPICRDGTLAKLCWGSFLLLREHAAGEMIEAYHAPFSSLPVYYVHTREALILSPDARLLASLAEEPVGINWHSVATQLAFDDFAFRNTCLTGIRELRGGEVLEWQQNTAPAARFIWDPWQHASQDFWIEDEASALELLEREINRCTSTRFHGLATPLLDLSGGLDSSILAAMVSSSKIDVRAVNMFAEATEGDERKYAGSVAEHLGITLTQAEPSAEHVDVRRCASPSLPRPHARSFVQEIDRLTLAAAPDAKAFINGGGGDAVFCHLQSSGPAVDVLLSKRGIGGFLRTVDDVASAAHVSFWVGLRKAITKSVRRHEKVWLRADPAFLTPDSLLSPSDNELPWPPPHKDARPGKLEHVRGIYSSCFNMHGFARSGDLKAVYPMLSQPLIEACLRIPTWMWLRQGHDRYLARKIAAKWLPAHVAWRQSKGGLGQLQRDVYRLNKDAIREMLLDGALRKSALLDRAAIEAQLAPESDLTSKQFARLLRIADFEAWAQHWT